MTEDDCTFASIVSVNSLNFTQYFKDATAIVWLTDETVPILSTLAYSNYKSATICSYVTKNFLLKWGNRQLLMKCIRGLAYVEELTLYNCHHYLLGMISECCLNLKDIKLMTGVSIENDYIGMASLCGLTLSKSWYDGTEYLCKKVYCKNLRSLEIDEFHFDSSISDSLLQVFPYLEIVGDIHTKKRVILNHLQLSKENRICYYQKWKIHRLVSSRKLVKKHIAYYKGFYLVSQISLFVFLRVILVS